MKSLMNGEALVTMAKSGIQRKWLWESNPLESRTIINSVKILSGTLPTNINKTRGNQNQELKKCRRCKKTAETDIHVLNECSHNKNAISRRHNMIVNKIAKELKKVGYVVWTEKTHSVNLINLKPDITIWKENICKLIEITIPYERNDRILLERELFKENKYKDIKKEHLSISNPTNEVKVIGIAIGTAGTINESTANKLTRLGLSKKITTALQMTVLHESSRIWRGHESGSLPDL